MSAYPQPKTLEEHREYLYEMIKLKMWFIAHWLKNHPEEKFVDVLRKRVDVYRKTDVNPGTLNPVELYWDDPRWQAMEKAAEESYNRNIDHPEIFEKEGLEIFKASLDARCERDMADRSECLRYQCGCLRHNPEATDDFLGFHIANFCRPCSFLDYPAYTKGCFQMLLDRAEFIYHVPKIGTGTWLNGNPQWLKWFPQEWKDNMSEPNKDVQWHFGFWGQFISARGTFNFKYGKILRETGEFPYYPRRSQCTIKAMREHLDKIHV